MDPFTIAAGISAASSIFKGITGLFGGNAANKAAEDHANQDNAEAGVAAQQALAQGDQVAAHAATQAAANGGGLVGSSLGVISNLSSQAMFNARAAVYRGQTQARSDLYQGAIAKTQGLQTFVSGAVGAASSLIGGFANSANFAKMQRAKDASGGDDGAGGDDAAGLI